MKDLDTLRKLEAEAERRLAVAIQRLDAAKAEMEAAKSEWFKHNLLHGQAHANRVIAESLKERGL